MYKSICSGHNGTDKLTFEDPRGFLILEAKVCITYKRKLKVVIYTYKK